MRTPLVAATILLAPRMAWAAEGGGSLVAVGGGILTVMAACLALLLTRRAWGMVATAAAGAGASLYLTIQHHVATTGGSSICNINATFNCDTVNTSRWSEIGGVPVALFGLGYFAAMTWLAWRRTSGSGSPMVVLAGAVLGTAVSAFMAFQSAQLGAWCLFCISTYASNLLLLGGATLEARQGKEAGSLFQEGGPAVAMGLAVFIVGLVVYQGQANASGPSAGTSTEDLGRYYSKVAGKIVLDGTEPVEGNPAAKFTVVEWADFECPHCALMAPELEKAVKENADLKVLFKHYPISGNCNQFVEGERHVNACNAAAAAECARLQGSFFELARAMFANQQYLSPDDIKFIAREKGLDVAALDTCMAKPETLQSVRDDVAAGGTARIDGTPSLFVLGLFGDEWVRLHGGREELNALLAAAREGKSLPAPQIRAEE